LGAGLELTTVLLGHPFDVLFALPVVTVVAVVAVGNGELPVEPEPDPGMAPQATSMNMTRNRLAARHPMPEGRKQTDEY